MVSNEKLEALDVALFCSFYMAAARHAQLTSGPWFTGLRSAAIGAKENVSSECAVALHIQSIDAHILYIYYIYYAMDMEDNLFLCLKKNAKSE